MLASKIAIATKHTISQSKVQDLRAAVLAELDNERAQQDLEREPRPIGAHVTAMLAEE